MTFAHNKLIDFILNSIDYLVRRRQSVTHSALLKLEPVGLWCVKMLQTSMDGNELLEGVNNFADGNFYHCGNFTVQSATEELPAITAC